MPCFLQTTKEKKGHLTFYPCLTFIPPLWSLLTNSIPVSYAESRLSYSQVLESSMFSHISGILKILLPRIPISPNIVPIQLSAQCPFSMQSLITAFQPST